ncbi:MAG TPA: indole-3-glycerol phosphate synthase TrpC [Candidatus Brocadiia bacterium]|nr:indole-3-glycerol phosphate synthase TrpC [Candidatus Brocadiia bacterium]
MTTILDRIVAAKRAELAQRLAAKPLAALEREALAVPPKGGFAQAIRPPQRGKSIRLIAEIKKASPSKGLIRPDFDPPAIARSYQAAGAAAISVLTDEPFFQGSLDDLRQVAAVTSLPLLRKDFTLDRYHLLEARQAGAAAVLLIAAILDDNTLASLLAQASELGLDAIVETHTPEEARRAVQLGSPIIGVNNRNLDTFEVSLTVSLNIRPLIPDDRIVISESGIATRQDALLLQDAGIDAILVGETLMRCPDPGLAARRLLFS